MEKMSIMKRSIMVKLLLLFVCLFFISTLGFHVNSVRKTSALQMSGSWQKTARTIALSSILLVSSASPSFAKVVASTDGSGYEGNWAEGRKHGIGFERLVDQSEYRGEFVDGQKHGKGAPNDQV